MTTGGGRDLRRGLAAHALLAGSMALARALEVGTTSVGGRSGLAIEALLAAGALVLVAALGAAALATLRTRHPALLALALLLGLSLAERRTFDAFDLVYLLAVALSCTLVARREPGDGRAPGTAA